MPPAGSAVVPGPQRSCQQQDGSRAHQGHELSDLQQQARRRRWHAPCRSCRACQRTLDPPAGKKARELCEGVVVAHQEWRDDAKCYMQEGWCCHPGVVLSPLWSACRVLLLGLCCWCYDDFVCCYEWTGNETGN